MKSKSTVDDELQILQHNIKELLPKVQTVNAKDGEPISSDWMDSW